MCCRKDIPCSKQPSIHNSTAWPKHLHLSKPEVSTASVIMKTLPMQKRPGLGLFVVFLWSSQNYSKMIFPGLAVSPSGLLWIILLKWITIQTYTMFVYVCLDIFPSTSSELILDLCFCVVNRPFKLPVSLIFHHGIHNSGFQNWGPPQWTVCSPWDCTILYQLHRLLHNRQGLPQASYAPCTSSSSITHSSTVSWA